MAVHHINKVVLDFSFPAKEKDTALQQTRAIFYEKILPTLTAACDAVTGHVYIDRMEIDLGALLPESIQQEFIKSFVIKDPGYSEAVAPPPGRAAQPAEKSGAGALLFYLSNGYWEWNFQQRSFAEQARFISELFSHPESAAAVFQQLQLLPSYSGKRLLLLIAPSLQLQQALLNALKIYHPVIPAVHAHLPTGWEKQVFRDGSFFFALVARLLGSAPLSRPQEMVRLLQDTGSGFRPVIPEQQSVAPETKAFSTARAIRWIKEFFGQSSRHKKTAIPHSPSTNTLAPEKHSGKKRKAAGSSYLIKQLPTNSTVPPFQPEESPEDKQTGVPLIPAEEKIFISNAGLILFHPFLQAAFTDLGWLDGTRHFINERVQQKAILLLQYLCNGKSRQAEHELVLNKLLCNWPVALPLSVSANFSKKEKQVCTDLLEALLEYWSVLKNTSAAGLLESFVNRKGLIQQKEDGYLLQVEKKSIDILIESLPFSLFTIKLPWNEQIIYTEW